jgi:hypothetical protein
VKLPWVSTIPDSKDFDIAKGANHEAMTKTNETADKIGKTMSSLSFFKTPTQHFMISHVCEARSNIVSSEGIEVKKARKKLSEATKPQKKAQRNGEASERI